MRKKLWIGALVIGLAVALLLAVPFFLDIERFRPQIETQLQAALGRPVRLGRLQLTLVPFAIRADAITIAEDPRFHRSTPFVQADQLRVRPAFWPLLRGQVEIDALELERPRIELIQDTEGRWNWETLGLLSGSDRAAGDAASAPAAGDAPHALPALLRAAIRDGRITRTDLAAQQPPQVIEHIDLQLADFAPGKEFTIEGSLQLPGAKSQAISWTGQGGPLDPADPAATPLELKLRLDEIDLAGLQALLGSSTAAAGAIVTGEIRLHARAPKIDLAGKLTLDHLRAGDVELTEAIEADFELSADTRLQQLTIQRGRLLLGGTPLTLKGEATWSVPARIQLAAEVQNAELSRLLALGALFSGEALAGIRGQGQASLQLRLDGSPESFQSISLTGSGKVRSVSLELPAISSPVRVRQADFVFDRQSVRVQSLAGAVGGSTVSGSFSLEDFKTPRVRFDLAVDQILVSEWQGLLRDQSPAKASAALRLAPVVQAATRTEPSLLHRISGQGQVRVGALRHEALTLTRLHAPVTLAKSVITLKPFTAEVCGGTQTGAITLDLGATPARCLLASTMRQVDANRLVSSVSSLKETLYGLLASNIETRFQLGGQPDLLRSLDGPLELALAKGRLAGVDFLRELAAIGQFAGVGGKPESFTSFVRLTGKFVARDGVARTENLKISMAQGDLAATGAFNLLDHGLDLRLTAVLSPEASAKAGGSKVGGFMTTALSNREGQLVIPVLVRGTLDKPRISPDLKMVAELKMRQYFPSAGGFGEITGSILDLFGGKGKSSKPSPDKK